MILKAIRHLLLNDFGVQPLQPAVHVGFKPQDETGNSVVLHLISAARGHHMTGPSGFVKGTVQIDAYAAEPKDADELADAIRQCLDGRHGTVTDLAIDYIELDDQRALNINPPKGRATPIFGISADYRYAHRELTTNPNP
jgi:hypothetical protein